MNEFLLIQTRTGWGQVLRGFADWCRPQPGWSTLDVGTGPGLLPALLAERGCRSIGVDLHAAAFQPAPLHPRVIQADVLHLPFPSGSFELVTACNLLFLLPDPEAALGEMARMLVPGGQAALLNPSESINEEAARLLADERSLEGVARKSLLDWARRAETHPRWSVGETADLFAAAGLRLDGTALRVGPGFARFAKGARI